MFEMAEELSTVGALGPDRAREWRQEVEVACASGRAAVDRMEQLPPGPELAAALEQAKSLPIDGPSRIRLSACWSRQLAWTEAQAMAAFNDAAGMADEDLHRCAIADLAQFTKQSEHSLERQFALVRQVGESLGETWVALNSGLITANHLRALAAVLANVTPELARKVQAEVLPPAIDKRWRPGQLADAARRALLRLDPLGAEQRSREAKKRESGVWLRPDADQMATVIARGDAWSGRQIMDEINRRADAMGRDGDNRSLGERQIEALRAALVGDDDLVVDSDGETHVVDPETGVVDDRPRPARQPKRATALLLITLDTLLGGNGPGHLEGYGAITADLARRIAASDIRFRRLVLDPLSGRPVDVGSASHDLSPEMRRYIDALDRTCRMAGCSRAAHFCDADHGVEWPEGETTCDNCGLLCRKHHNLKTKKLFTLVRQPDRSVDWTSPFGFNWHQEAATYEEFLEADPGEPALAEDPDPPPDDEPLPDAPPPVDDDDIDHDEFTRLVLSFAR